MRKLILSAILLPVLLLAHPAGAVMFHGSVTGRDTTRQVRPPMIKKLSTSSDPVKIRVPKVAGGSYTINYATGPVRIDLLPPEATMLPVSRDLITGSTVESPEAQGMGFFTTFTTDQGLALDGLTDIVGDSRGYLWLCTAGGGVSRYDGKSFVNFTTSQGLANNSVWCATQDLEGNMWFGTQGGASRYDGRTFKSFTTSDGLLNNIIRSIATDYAGNIWLGTNGGGVSRFDGKSFTNFTSKEGLAFDYIYDITVDKPGNVWFGTVGGGVSRFDGKTFITYNSKNGIAGDVVVSTCEDKSGNLWFGSYGAGVTRFDGKEFRIFTTREGLANNTVWKIMCDRSGNIWFGTDGGGVSRFDGKSFTGFTMAQGLSNNTVWGIAEDRDGNIWFGTLGGGVCRYNGRSFTNFTTAQGLGNNLVRTIIEDGKRNIWFGTDQGGITRYDGRSFTRFSISQGLSNETVWSSSRDSKGNLWFGTAGGGVFRYDGDTFTDYSTDQGLANPIIRSIIEDRKGNMWFGSWQGGVSRFDGTSFTTYGTDQGLPNNSVMDMAEDDQGNIWFGTYGGGVSVFDGSRFRNFGSADGLISNNVKCITIDRSGNIWTGTEGGISVVIHEKVKYLIKGSEPPDGKSFLNITTKNGLPNNSVMKILQSRKGTIYAGTNYGICELTIDKNGNLKPGKQYYSSTGYPVKDISTGFNTIYEDSGGIIWAATGSDRTGLARFNPDYISENLTAPGVIIQGIKINNENISWTSISLNGPVSRSDSLALINEDYQTFGRELDNKERMIMKKKFGGIRFAGITKYFPVPEELVLPHVNNNITIEFNALEPGRHQMVRYSYLLEGYDREWSPVSDKSTAVFGNIFEGAYTFRVKARNPDGVWSEPTVYSFRVLPPWYRTWIMYFAYGIVIVTALYSIYRWRIARLRRENLVLEEKVRLRTLELQQANKEIEAQRDLVTRQKEHIEEIHKEVTDSIHYAKRLQTSALPNLKELGKQFGDLFIVFRPKDVVSGDFYWYAKSGTKMIFTVADCTGHGVPGAFMSMLGISLLKEIVIKGENSRPDLILNILREEIIRALGQTGVPGEQKDGMDISLCSVDINTFIMHYAGANLPCLIVREGNLTELKGDKMPIAIYEKMDNFSLQEFRLKKGDTVYLSSDGYHDQFGGPANKKFMSKRFKELLVSISTKPLEEQRMILEKTIDDWKDNYETRYPQTDDITVLGLKI